MHSPLSAFFLILLRTYRVVGSLVGFRSSCRFYPSCSVYAGRAIEKQGASRGGRKALGRLFRCHPWNPGGIDLPEMENS